MVHVMKLWGSSSVVQNFRLVCPRAPAPRALSVESISAPLNMGLFTGVFHH
ncbi:hypothetical protein PF002_g27102 [Phytophthora fragariae]|uniref:Uncharacterized protein n=1 Tax=Phytophthora fragariae TaxID=53985 RepID=A0A6A3WE04_9STRA|nr:hypothetical protein PF003_g33552 [Phytophthora fragariae]KAE8972254.1 hypothetical protein PF011_g25705 [Phytophthora fragariae]KAE9088625.1 hypothetical protein PF006_g25537 [Phytophthora fragariae]KAE9176277.1 hypothetical protein PF004_g26143 [Phytophthora fragariae]KAE9182057.1 hypothetical protein PF002_g27102 [Phytophthora fragariae]